MGTCLQDEQIKKTDELLSSIESLDHGCKIPDCIWKNAEEITMVSLLPEQTYGEDRPPTEDDFVKFKGRIDGYLSNVLRVLSKLVDLKQRLETSFELFQIKRDVLVAALVLCGEHSVPDIWTTIESCNLAAECIKTLCHLCSCESTFQLLIATPYKSFGHIFKQSLIFLRPKLLKDTWRRYPGAVSSYKWMLTQVYSPHLSEYLNMVLPTALIILDDYVVERRLIGLTCISHIISNVTRTELCQHGFHNVIFKALEHILLLNDVEQIQPLMACLTKLLHLTEHGYTRCAEPGMWNRFDDILQVVISKMSVEDKIALRKAYIKSVGPLISAMGPSVIRWSKPLLAVIDEYLHKQSFDTRSDALKVLLIYQRFSLVRFSHNGDQILFLLLRTLYDISLDEIANSASETSCTLETLEECLQTLKDGAPEKFDSLKPEVSKMECNLRMKSVLNKYFS